jgi:hypothetical protein
MARRRRLGAGLFSTSRPPIVGRVFIKSLVSVTKALASFDAVA